MPDDSNKPAEAQLFFELCKANIELTIKHLATGARQKAKECAERALRYLIASQEAGGGNAPAQ